MNVLRLSPSSPRRATSLNEMVCNFGRSRMKNEINENEQSSHTFKYSKMTMPE